MSQDKEPYGFWHGPVILPTDFPEGYSRITRSEVPKADNIYGDFTFYTDGRRFFGRSEDVSITWQPTQRELTIEESAGRVRTHTKLQARRN